MDKCEGFSACGGPLFAETRSALYDCPARPRMVSFVYGLGGRDVTTDTFRAIYEDLAKGENDQVYRHVGVRGDEDGIQA